MSNEDKLHSKLAQASQAKSLIENEMLAGAFDQLKRSYSEKLFMTTVDQSTARESLYVAYRVVAEVEKHLQSILDTGKLADAELNRLIHAAKAKPKWEQV